MALVNALARPDLGERDQALAEHLSLGAIVGHVLRRNRDAHLVEDELDLARQVVPLLADDRDLTGLRDQQLAELLQLGARRIPACEDPEVDLDVQSCGLSFRDERDRLLDCHGTRITGPAES